MSGGSNIRAIGSEQAQDAQGATGNGEGDATGELRDDETYDVEDDEVFDEPQDVPPTDRWWIYAVVAGTAIAGWTGFFGWTIREDLAAGGVALPQWRDWVVDWAIPVLLVGVAWLIARRNSRREALRFGETAALLAHESAELETRLAATNRELSLAREFLASQSRELESLGRVASERISKHSEELQDLIRDNGEQVELIGTTSESALANMNKLRDDLPVIANSARDTTNQIGNAGRTADEQLVKLVAGFERLNEFGAASEQQVSALSEHIGKTLNGYSERLEALEAMTAERFEVLSSKSREHRTELDSLEVQALAAMRQRADDLRRELAETSASLHDQHTEALEAIEARIDRLASGSSSLTEQLRKGEEDALTALGLAKDRLYGEIAEVIERLSALDQTSIKAYQTRVKALYEEAARFEDRLEERDRTFLAEMARRQDEFDTRETQASELLSQRLATLDEALQERREKQVADTEKLVEHSQAIATQFEQLNQIFEKIEVQGTATSDMLSAGLAAFDEQLSESRSQLSETGTTMEQLTDSGVRLLEIVQSGARQSREDLVDAIAQASEQLSAVEQSANGLSAAVEHTGARSTDLIADLSKAQQQIDQADAAIETLRGQIAENSDNALAKLNAMKAAMARLTDETQSLSGEVQDTLKDAISKLEEATRAAFSAIDSGTREKLADLASKAGTDAVQALERSLRNESAEAIGRLEQSAAHASGVGREAATQLRDQLAKVNELTGNLEQRVSRARELAQEQTNNDFARRMALITDSLNSASIDIASALSSEIADTSWDAYLKGDRGIFTRRAVRLLDAGETREIAELYQDDEGFKETVNRYIHDFEAMLRTMLSTRDGNALSVTLLGSDIGKLYVVLAQAIERFRS